MKLRSILILTGAWIAFSPVLTESAHAGQPARKTAAAQSAARRRALNMWSARFRTAAEELNRAAEAQRAARAAAIREELERAARQQQVAAEINSSADTPQPAPQAEPRKAPADGVTAQDIQDEMVRSMIMSNTLQLQFEANRVAMPRWP